jgi:hypothetical protein
MLPVNPAAESVCRQFTVQITITAAIHRRVYRP